MIYSNSNICFWQNVLVICISWSYTLIYKWMEPLNQQSNNWLIMHLIPINSLRHEILSRMISMKYAFAWNCWRLIITNLIFVQTLMKFRDLQIFLNELKQIDHDEGNEKEFISTSFIILSNLILTPFTNHEHLTRKNLMNQNIFPEK